MHQDEQEGSDAPHPANKKPRHSTSRTQIAQITARKARPQERKRRKSKSKTKVANDITQDARQTSKQQGQNAEQGQLRETNTQQAHNARNAQRRTNPPNPRELPRIPGPWTPGTAAHPLAQHPREPPTLRNQGTRTRVGTTGPKARYQKNQSRNHGN